MNLLAASAGQALAEALLTVKADDASIEVWDETGLVLERKSPSTSTGSSYLGAKASHA